MPSRRGRGGTPYKPVPMATATPYGGGASFPGLFDDLGGRASSVGDTILNVYTGPTEDSPMDGGGMDGGMMGGMMGGQGPMGGPIGRGKPSPNPPKPPPKMWMPMGMNSATIMGGSRASAQYRF